MLVQNFTKVMHCLAESWAKIKEELSTSKVPKLTILCMRRVSPSEWISQWSVKWEHDKAGLNARRRIRFQLLSRVKDARIEVTSPYRSFPLLNILVVNVILVHGTNPRFSWVFFYFFGWFFVFVCVCFILIAPRGRILV